MREKTLLKRIAAATIWVVAAVLAGTPADAQQGPVRHSLQVVLLGTQGGPVASPERSEPASLLLVDGMPYLIDAGEGTARQLATAGYQPADVHRIFITHHHLDHTAGLEPLIGLSWIGAGLAGKSEKTDIYGPPATEALVSAALAYVGISERIFRAGIASLPQAETMFTGHDIRQPGDVYSDSRVRVIATENTHFSHPSVASGGQKDMSLSYRFDTPGGSVVFTGDTGPSDAVAALAKGADLLVSEVYVSAPTPAQNAGSALSRELADHLTREHLTPEAVGQLAARAGVKAVLLTHLVAAADRNLARNLRERIGKFYSGPVIVGHDLLTYQFPQTK